MIEKIKEHKIKIISIVVGLALAASIVVAVKRHYATPPTYKMGQVEVEKEEPKAIEPPKVFHIKTPPYVKAAYVTSWVATLKERRSKLVQLINTTELNAIVIDIKDFSGKVLFDTNDPEIKKIGNEDIRMKDLRAWIEELHKNNIYVIARLTVFQDPLYAEKFPDQAVQTDTGKVWRDRNNLAFVDVSSQQFWDYIIRIAKAAEQAGFDEINFDYIRFPSDGNMKNIKFPKSGPEAEGKDNRQTRLQKLLVAKKASPNAVATPNIVDLKSPKQIKLEAFFKYLHTEMQPVGIPISADLFGMITTNHDDLGIGQVLESAAPYFDYICPMVYPSHYPRGYLNYNNPADHPYEIVHYAMSEGVKRIKKMKLDPQKLRPWLQDFNMGATYDVAKVKAQIKATHDSGLHSYLMWDPRNKYTKGAYTVTQNEQVTH